ANSSRSRDVFMLSRDCDDLRRRLEENADACEEADRAFKDKKQALEDVKAQRRDVEDRRDEWQQKVRDLEADAASHQEAAAKAKNLLEGVETKYRRLRRDVDGALQRIGVLRSMEQEHEGLGRPLRSSLRHSSPGAVIFAAPSVNCAGSLENLPSPSMLPWGLRPVTSWPKMKGRRNRPFLI
ncbi:MAG: hypothetical protein ACLUQN_03275, partial [Megasphaera sp.]